MLKRVGAATGVAAVLIALTFVPLSHPALDRWLSANMSRALNLDVSIKQARLSLVDGFASQKISIRKKGIYNTVAHDLVAVPTLVLTSSRPRLQWKLTAGTVHVGQELISEMLSTDRVNLLTFDSAESTLTFYPHYIDLTETRAQGADCRLNAEGTCSRRDDSIDLKVDLALSPSVSLDIPESLKRNLLGEDDSGFTTFGLHVSGKTQLPSIELASDRFRITTRTRKQ